MMEIAKKKKQTKKNKQKAEPHIGVLGIFVDVRYI